jgi:hypothetical protein
MDEAHKLAQHPEDKARVELWKRAVWSYMKVGRECYIERMKAPVPEVKVSRVTDADGDFIKVDWSKAASIGKKWYRTGGNKVAVLKLSGNVCHDGKYLYLRLIDYTDPKKLTVSPQIACFDDWEIVIARQKAQPFRQYMIGPSAMTAGLSYGEVNWRQGVNATEYTKKSFGLKAESNMSGDKWITMLAFPLEEMSDQPMKTSDSFYMNIMRVSNPALSGETGKFIIDTWVSHTTVKDVDRLGLLKLGD